MTRYKKSYNSGKKKSGMKEKGKTGLMWTGILSIVYFAYSYIQVWPYVLFGAQGVELAFPDLTIPMNYFVTAAKIFVASAGIWLVARFVLDVRKKDIENV